MRFQEHIGVQRVRYNQALNPALRKPSPTSAPGELLAASQPLCIHSQLANVRAVVALHDKEIPHLVNKLRTTIPSSGTLLILLPSASLSLQELQAPFTVVVNSLEQ